MKYLEVKHGSIYSHGRIVEDLGFLLTLDRETRKASLYKYGDSSWLPEEMKRLDPLHELLVPCVFSFGAYYDSVYSKEDQLKIVNYMIERSLNQRTTDVAMFILTDEIGRLKLIFDEMIEITDKEN